MLIHDVVPAVAREITPEGFMRVRARIARAGLHDYRAAELGLPDGFGPDDTVRVYRPPDQVFDASAMESFAGKPITDGHPPAMVDAGNWKRYAIGYAGSDIARDGDHLAADLLITDADAVLRAEGGAELSNGYHADFDFKPGTTPDGESYDAIQSNIRGNHIALVNAGRCGETCRIGDRAVLDCGCDGELRTVTVDGTAVEVTAAGAEAIGRLMLALEARDGAIAALTAKVLDETGLDARVRERWAALDGARTVFGPGFDGTDQTAAEIRRLVVARLLGTDLDGRSDAYVEAAFDALLSARAVSNPLASHLAAAASADSSSAREAARQSRDRFLTHAWKGDHPHGAR
jgi:uncharacterized protein